MKKIGIITYHFAENYGAVLQCYALQTILEKRGHHVKVLNYVNDRQRLNNGVFKHGEGLKTVIVNICLLPFLPFRIKKKRKFNIFCKNLLKLSVRFNSIEQLEKNIYDENFDFVISGSDQVFNPNIDDFDVAFLLPFSTKARKMSYGASTGNATPDILKPYNDYIRNFNHISIREEKDIYKFDKDIQRRIKVVSDPVLLLDKSEWNKTITLKKMRTRYLLCYFLHKELYKDEFSMSKAIAKKLGLKLIAINARYSIESFRSGTLFDVGPTEFVNLIANAEYVCTDSFHGTLFSLIYEKNFSCFDTEKNSDDSRRKNLLEKVGAEYAIQFVEKEIKINDLNYKIVNEQIKRLKTESLRYLEMINND